ncbi:MAG: hypothetical protein HKN13_03940 [Rhodothermales bacterium]|nr:hypothetical protein [Rhodothermales bacterium]
MRIVDVTPENVSEEGFFCIKTSSRPGFASKQSWFEQRFAEGLRLKILRDDDGHQISFIEYVPAEHAWRPVSAPDYIFIHCISGYRKEHRGKGYASLLIEACESDAGKQGKAGVTVMTSDGPWMASMQVFVKNGYEVMDRRGRFELMAKRFDEQAADPRLINWEENAADYGGWHLLYADQCPWHDKAANDLLELANSEGIDLCVTKITSADQARRAPSGFGVFSLVHDGELIEDHYISKTRFRNILRKRLA